MKLDDNDFDDEVNNLIEWCEDLDYEKYVGNWHSLATSAQAGATLQKYDLSGINQNTASIMMRSGQQLEQDQPPHHYQSNPGDQFE